MSTQYAFTWKQRGVKAMIMFQKMSEYPSIMEEEFAWAWITQWCPCVQYGGGHSFGGVTAPYQWESGYRHAWINSQPSCHAWWFPNLYTCNIPGPSWNNTLNHNLSLAPKQLWFNYLTANIFVWISPQKCHSWFN